MIGNPAALYVCQGILSLRTTCMSGYSIIKDYL